MTNTLACRYWVAALSIVCLLATVAEARETKLRSEVSAAENINPNRRGTPQPVKLHIFYLAEDDAFLAANFGDLVNPESPVLGEELVRRTETLVGPGEVLALDEAFDEAAKFIGVVAAFTDIDLAVWRAVEAVPEKKWTDVVRLLSRNKLEIKIEGTSVSCAIVRN
jgi:type VI secretion system protein VasD